jgi:hypothetical protein
MGHISSILNIAGLCFDIVGIIILYRFGLLAELTAATLNSPDIKNEPDWERESKQYGWISKLGLILIVLGFLFQLSANIVSLIKA